MSKNIYQAQNPNSIKRLFSSIAPSYDFGNALLSGRLHRRWNRYLVEQTVLSSQPREYLDLCCGTADIARLAVELSSTQPPHRLMVYLMDFCPEMLVYAQHKFSNLKEERPVDLQFTVADAQNIPLADQSVDCVTIAYGIRNVADPYLCLQEVFRVLRSGGKLGILELTRPEHPILRWGHSLYLHSVVPVVGRLLTANREAYSYLQQSIHRFIPPKALGSMLRVAGFQHVQIQSLTGGIASLFTGVKQ